MNKVRILGIFYNFFVKINDVKSTDKKREVKV